MLLYCFQTIVDCCVCNSIIFRSLWTFPFPIQNMIRKIAFISPFVYINKISIIVIQLLVACELVADCHFLKKYIMLINFSFHFKFSSFFSWFSLKIPPDSSKLHIVCSILSVSISTRFHSHGELLSSWKYLKFETKLKYKTGLHICEKLYHLSNLSLIFLQGITSSIIPLPCFLVLNLQSSIETLEPRTILVKYSWSDMF